MKKIVLLVFSLACALIINAQQDYQIGDLKKNLSEYKSLCQKIQEHIDDIEKAHDVLSDMRTDVDIQKLVYDINKSGSKLKEKVENLDSRIAALAEVLKRMQKTGNDDSKKDPGDNNYERMRLFLKKYTLKELYEKKDSLDVEKRLNDSGNATLVTTYEKVFNLYSVQYNIYEKSKVNSFLEEAEMIAKGSMASEEHFNQLHEEIEKVKGYRYATLELRRLTRIISNPDEDILKEIRKGQSSSSVNKWAEKEEIDVPAIAAYLKKTHETEYIDMYPYTKNKFDEYVNSDSTRRKEIEEELANALK